MSQLTSLHILVGIVFGLICIMVYCLFKATKQLKDLIEIYQKYKESIEELKKLTKEK